MKRGSPQLTYDYLRELGAHADSALGVKNPTFAYTRVRQRIVAALHDDIGIVRPQSNADYPSSLGKVEFTLGATGRADALVIKSTHTNMVEFNAIVDIDYMDFEYAVMPRLKLDVFTSDDA